MQRYCINHNIEGEVFAGTILGLYNVFDNPRQVFAAILDAADYRVLSSQPVPSCPPAPPFSPLFGTEKLSLPICLLS